MADIRIEEISVVPVKDKVRVVTWAKTPYGRMLIVSTGKAPKNAVRQHMKTIEKKVEEFTAEKRDYLPGAGHTFYIATEPVG